MFPFMRHLTTLSELEYLASDGNMTNGALNRLWKEVNCYCGTFLEELMKTMKSFGQHNWRPGPESKRELSEIKSTTSSQVCTVKFMLTRAGRIQLPNPTFYNPAHTNTNLVRAI
jgi:hypothetical protein